MTLYETGEIFFGFSLYFKEDFNFIKYDYHIPHNRNQQCIRYITGNKHILEKYSVYGKRTIIIFALMNQLKYRMGYQINYEMDESDSSYFFDMIINYKRDFKKDVDFLLLNLTSLFDIYTFHVKKQIKWYTIAYVLALLKCNKEEVLADDLVKHEMKYITKALKVFRFDSTSLVELLQPLQKKFDLIEI